MARLITAGAELQGVDGGTSAAGIDGGATTLNAGNTVTYDTTVKRSGAASYKCVTGATAGFAEASFPFTLAVGTTGFSRGYINVPSSVGWPSAGGALCKITTAAAATIAEVRVSSTGVATLWASNVQVGTGSYQLALNTWHRIEMKILVPAAGNGTLALQIDGASVVPDTSVSIGTTAAGGLLVGAVGANSTNITNYTVSVDDVAVNDSTGTAQNSYPGAGSVVLLTPASDNARVNWTTDSTGTTNLWDAVNNEPPTGIADTTTGSGVHQIRDAVSSATDNYDANLQTYSAAGVPAQSTVTLVQACAITSAASSTSPPTVALFLVSNAGGTTEGSETSVAATVLAAGTWPTTWNSKKNTPLIVTSQPTLSSAPVLRMGKRTASTRIAMCCFMGLTVEYIPPPLLAGLERARHPVVHGPRPSRGRF